MHPDFSAAKIEKKCTNYASKYNRSLTYLKYPHTHNMQCTRATPLNKQAVTELYLVQNQDTLQELHLIQNTKYQCHILYTITKLYQNYNIFITHYIIQH